MTIEPRVRAKWRPPLSLILFGVLLTVLALPAAIVIGFRALDGTTSRMGAVEIAALALALVLTLLIAFVLSRTLTQPIHALIDRAAEIEQGGRAAIRPIERYGTRELASLGQSFLLLAERLVERTERVRSFANHTAHELKSPLTSIKGAAELMRDAEVPGQAMSAGERRHFLNNIIADTARLSALLDRLRELARAELPLDGPPARLGDLVDNLRLRFPSLAIVTEGDPSCLVPLSQEAGLIVLGHLADNAGRHGAKSLTIKAEPQGALLCLNVWDDGSGISPLNRDKVFEPFFTTRRETGGTGLGLDIVRTVLRAHGGSIALADSAPGARFELLLPQAR